MSSDNGTRIASKEELRQKTRETLTLPRASARLGRPFTVEFRAIDDSEVWLLSPELPEEAETWPEKLDLRQAALKAWETSLTREQRTARRREQYAVNYGVIAAALVDPPMTVVEVQNIIPGDVTFLANRILAFSGIGVVPPPAMPSDADATPDAPLAEQPDRA